MRRAPRLGRSRRGFFFLPLLDVLVLVIMVYSLIVIQNKEEIPPRTGPIGKNPLDVVVKIQEGEKALIFMDTAAKMALYQSLYDLQLSGGLTDSSQCGEYFGFNMWNSASGQRCVTDSSTVKASLRDLMQSNIVARAAAYPTADFVGNLPGTALAQGRALTAGNVAGITVRQGGASSEDDVGGDDADSAGDDADTASDLQDAASEAGSAPGDAAQGGDS